MRVVSISYMMHAVVKIAGDAKLRRWPWPIKLKFHGTDTDTDIDTDTDFLADFRAKILAEISVSDARGSRRAPRRGSRPAAARGPFSSRLVRGLLSDARFSSRGCPLGMRACTRVRVLYMINYRVHVYKITRYGAS